MTEGTTGTMGETPDTTVFHKTEIVRKGLPRRHAAEKRFKIYGIIAICFALGMLSLLVITIVSSGYSAFFQTYVKVQVNLSPDDLGVQRGATTAQLQQADYRSAFRSSIRAAFPDVSGRTASRALFALFSTSAEDSVKQYVLANPDAIGKTVPIWVKTSSDVDQWNKGNVNVQAPEESRRIKDNQLAWLTKMKAAGDIESRFNTTFFSAGDSREPEQAGFWGAVVGSFFTMVVTLLLAFPLGVATAVYLEEFAPKNRWTDLVEVNINNLAAVPSIVFGLLGLAVFLSFFGLPRSAPLVGGMVLALMTLPTIIISSRAALKAVPPSIREAAYGLGASKVQVVTHHVIPLAMPGILTGTIIGMAQALGETAPLLMIGMVAFIVDIPGGFTDPSTVMPVQIYLWADSPERAFVEKTSGAIMVLLLFLVFMNALAVFLRKKFERRW